MSRDEKDEQQTFWSWLCKGPVEHSDERAKGALDLSGARNHTDPESAKRLHRDLEEAVGSTVDLAITNNRRRMVTAKKRKARHEFRVHHMFVDAEPGVVAALAGMIRGEDGARDEVRAFVRENRDAIDFEPDDSRLTARGEHHDLDDLMARALQHLPDDREPPSPRITWGRRGRGRRSIRFGSYDFDLDLIRIHPSLDEAWVPAFFVEFVVFHELLHAVFPPETIGGRREIHTDAFKAWEETFPRFQEAMDWEAENIGRFLR